MFRLSLLVLCAVAASRAAVVRSDVGDSEDLSGKAAVLVNNVNDNLRQRGLNEVNTPNQSYSNLLSSGSIKNVVFRDLTSLSLVGKNQVITRTTTEQGQNVSMDLTLSLGTFQVEYDYQIVFLHHFRKEGHLKVTAGSDSFRLQVALNKEADQCVASVVGFYLLELGDYSADITPKTFSNEVIAFLANLARYTTVGSDFTYFNKLIKTYIDQEEFKNTISEVLCASVNF